MGVEKAICWSLNILLWTMMWMLTALLVAELAVGPDRILIEQIRAEAVPLLVDEG